MMTAEKMSNQIMRCLVGACDETCGYYNCSDNICDAPLGEMHEFLANASKAIDVIEQVKCEIKESKKILSDPATIVNEDYRTGYLCGLAFVEGLIAELEGDKG